MKKILLPLLFTFSFLPAQNFGLNEYFETEINDHRWSTFDLDGDGKSWNLTPSASWTTNLGFEGYVYVSESYDHANNQALNPDNVLVSPTFIYEYPHVKNANYLIGISYQISASNPSKYAETYAVYLLPATQTFTGNETPIYYETLTTGTISKNVFVENWNFSGLQVKLYFRHFQSQNQNALVIDNISNYNYTMSVDNTVHKNENVIFPNPAKDKITIKLKENIEGIEVIDLNGRKFDLKESNKVVDVQLLQSGVYFIKINTKNSSYINKFIKK